MSNYESALPDIEQLKGKIAFFELWIDCVHNTMLSIPKKERVRFENRLNELVQAKMEAQLETNKPFARKP